MAQTATVRCEDMARMTTEQRLRNFGRQVFDRFIYQNQSGSFKGSDVVTPVAMFAGSPIGSKERELLERVYLRSRGYGIQGRRFWFVVDGGQVGKKFNPANNPETLAKRVYLALSEIYDGLEQA